MIKKHREQRTNIKTADRENKKSHHKEKNHDKCDIQDNYNHGVKRSGSHSWEGDSHKVSKYKHQTDFGNDEKLKNCNGCVKDVNMQPPSSGNKGMKSDENMLLSSVS